MLSFDLYVWHESLPITADEAREKLDRWGEGEIEHLVPNLAVTSLYDALLISFPPLESLSDDDVDRLGVWSWTPERSDRIVAASCVWSRAHEVYTAIRELAVEYGVVCYEPGHDVLNPNAPGYVAPFTVTSESLPPMPDPDADRLKWIMDGVGADNRYAILERADGWFVQVGYGETAGVPAGTYALEYREGDADQHFRCRSTDRQEATRLLVEFLAGDETWKHRHRWQPLAQAH